MMQQLIYIAHSIGELLSVVFGFVFVLALAIPKVGEAIIGRILSGSLERQKAKYAENLETHKNLLAKELEEVKTNLSVQLDTNRQQLALLLSTKEQILHFQQKCLQDIRSEAAGLYAKGGGNSDEKYGYVSALVRNAMTYGGFINKDLRDELIGLLELIEEPLTLIDPNFCNDVDQKLLHLINVIDLHKI
jgi:predicted house-cleaning noncanonical NTP pyrophosphatase (MazG superfamily)